MGHVAASEAGKIYVDVGNAFCPGVLDHHHPDAPDACTAMLVLNHPEYVNSQILNEHLTIIPHEYPDLDAVTGAWFAARHANRETMGSAHEAWANYVCRIDQGHTTLDVEQPVTPYSLFMMRMHGLRMAGQSDSEQMLKSGFEFLEVILEWIEEEGDLLNPDSESLDRLFPAESQAIGDDLNLYRNDLNRTEKMDVKLPLKDRSGFRNVPGLWIEKPESALFKSWARGDAVAAGNDEGFVFLGVQVSDQRFILSVDPSSDVNLRGLGEALERAETKKRKILGMERQGENRPGYSSPDPWYDGRSALHHFTIIDSPRAGTVLIAKEVRDVFLLYEAGIQQDS